jgi:hypothetical protein
MPPHDPFLKQMYEEKLRGGGTSQLTNSTKAILMAQRVGLPSRLGTEIYRMVTISYINYPASWRMFIVANAIKYAADNRDQLKPQWRVGT